MMNCSFAIKFATLILAIDLLTVCAADFRKAPAKSENPADKLVRHTIFEENGPLENTIGFHQAALQLELAERFEFLADWVLPADDHPTFRVTGEFGSTNPLPFAEQPSETAARLSPGVVVMSPAVDLVDTAQQLDRLNELRERIVSARPVAGDAQQNYAKATLLFLVELGREDFAAAALVFDEVITESTKLDVKLVESRWPALLMLRAAMSSPDNAIRRHVTEYFFSIYPDLGDYNRDTERDVLNDHLRAMFALNQFLGENGSIAGQTPASGKQWIPFSFSSSKTRGYGRPATRWHSDSGSVQKLVGHEMDYLSFRSPLRGNFEVECDFSSGHGEHSSFLIAGSTVQAIADGASLRIGNFRKHFTDIKLDVPLTKFESTVRFRAVVRDGMLKQYLNGQEVLSKALVAEHDPWVAIRGWRRSLGGASDFRITGEPVIPDEINLTGDPELSGWAPYFEEGFGPGSGNWQASKGSQGGTSIFGRRRPEHAGSAVQKLLRYCRPVAEDGTIEYDFFYKKGEACVHPALDRLAFLLDPGGVKIHWITDRRYERFEHDPTNVSQEPASQRGPSQLPLHNDAWNRLKIDVKGNVVQIALNGELIYERALEPSNQRTFGLFHFADRTEARVRNVVWRGDWPKEMPPLNRQNLASSELDFLDESSQNLAASFHHDFRDRTLLEKFDVVGEATAMAQNKSGLHTRQIDNVGIKNIRSCLQIYGDFDIEVAFQDLEILMPTPRWEAGIGVRVVLDSDTDDAVGFYRTLARNADNRRAAFYHSSRRRDGSIKVPGEFVVEQSTSGRFRIARRGSTVYSLYAADDSTNYRLVSKREVPAVPVAVMGLQLIMKGADTVSVAATWKELHVRAEQIQGLRVTAPQPVIAKLNAQREQLVARTIDFTNPVSLQSAFRFSMTDASTFVPEASGLRITTLGDERQTACVISSRIPIRRGSDLEFTMDIHRLGMTDTVKSSCEFALKVFLDSSVRNSRGPDEATFILRKQPEGSPDLMTRIVHRNRVNQIFYLPLHTLPVTSPNSFRLVVHEQTLYFLYSEAGSDAWHVAATSPVFGESPIVGFELKSVAVGTGHSTDLTLKKLIIHEQRDEPPGATTEVTRPQ
jgi:hypothetical protein